MTSTTSAPPTRPGGSSDDTQPLPVGAASHPGPGTLRYGRDPFPPGPAAAGHDGHGTAGLTERLGRRWLAGWGSVAHLLLNLPLGALWLVVPILVAVGVVTIPAAGVGIIVILAAIWIAAAIAWGFCRFVIPEFVDEARWPALAAQARACEALGAFEAWPIDRE